MIKSLYVHIPFCIRKCLYCDFNSCSNNELQDGYIDELVNEIQRIDIKNFETIFVGGGTPTILSLINLKKVLEALQKFNAAEYTFESNPGTINERNLSLLKEYGVNRLSIGLQAWQDSLLMKLGRIHNINDFLEGYNIARKVGFNNINVDLMFGIPDQRMEDWVETIRNVIEINPEHISCYGLIIEEGTPFKRLYDEDRLNLVEEDIERDMYHYAINELKQAGYEHYEISNFSKKGFECKHNITYWKLDEYLGVGAGSHSFINNKRFSNLKNIQKYINGVRENNIIEETSNVLQNDLLSEYMFLGLRMMDGISKMDFKKRFGENIEIIYGNEISDLIRKGLLIENNNNIKLSEKGIDFSNQVFVEFLK
jgi:oxygen-independent coproporphyrinogen-3 oxidase